jgi:hypothetical protein
MDAQREREREREREFSINWMPFLEQLLTGLCVLSIVTPSGTWAHPCELSINKLPEFISHVMKTALIQCDSFS